MPVGGIDWHAMARSEHIVHVRERDASLIDLVGEFLAPGLREGAACIVVATPEHQALLEQTLQAHGIDAQTVKDRGLLTLRDAQAMLSEVLLDGVPDTGLFCEVVGGLVERVIRNAAVHPVRIFGEMVDLLAHRGATDAARRLEQLWNDLARIHPFSLLCAYPVERFGGSVPFLHVCMEHSRVLPSDRSNEPLKTVPQLEREVHTLDAELSVHKRALRRMLSRMEEMAEANRRKDELLAALGADLRYPLAALQNAVLAARLGAWQRERALGIALRQARELTRHIDGLFDVTSDDRRPIALERRPLSLGEVLERAIDAMGTRFEARRHHLSISTAGNEVYVDGDPARLEQVVESLLIHASSYTPPEGSICVGVEQHGAEAILRVTDSGVGIDADAADTDREHGRGLAHAREIVELHGGRIEVCSEVDGRSSAFIVHLPALAWAPGRAPGTDLEWSRQAHILIVTDEPDAAEALALLLDVLGHKVAVAHDGDAALRTAQRTRPELVMIDIDQPAVNGCELARRMRASAYLEAVTLVGLSAHGQIEERQRAIDSGFCCVLSQPVELEGLREVLRRLPKPRPTV